MCKLAKVHDIFKCTKNGELWLRNKCTGLITVYIFALFCKVECASLRKFMIYLNAQRMENYEDIHWYSYKTRINIQCFTVCKNVNKKPEKVYQLLRKSQIYMVSLNIILVHSKMGNQLKMVLELPGSLGFMALLNASWGCIGIL